VTIAVFPSSDLNIPRPPDRPHRRGNAVSN
jgi:hypothetical protein